MDIVVLAGGISTEREVSIVSGMKVCEALREKKHHAVLLDVFIGENEPAKELFPAEYDIETEINKIKSWNDKIDEIKKSRREFFGPNVIAICQKADIVFLALHGENGENGKVQAAFDLMGICYTGTGPLGSAMAMDKGITKKILAVSDVPVPKGIILKKNHDSKNLEQYGMKFPVVVKPCCGGSSVGVCIANNQGEYQKALSESFMYEDETVVEQYIKGREFSVAVIDGKALPIIEIAPIEGFYDYKNKYQAGSTVETCPAELSKELTEKMQCYAVAGYLALSLEAYARLDFMLDESGAMYCLEANTLPGMTPTSLIPQEAQALGMNYPDLCEELIRVSLTKKETAGD